MNMSTSDNLTQTLSPADDASSTDLGSAAQLKQAFADNECPDGADFAMLIDSAFNKVDGPIRELADKQLEVDTETRFYQGVDIAGDLDVGSVSVADALITSGNANIGGTLTVNGSTVAVGANGKTTLTEDGLTVGDALSLAQDGPLKVYTAMEVDQKSQLKGSVQISKSADQAEPSLTVQGDLVSDKVTIDEKIILGDASAHIEIAENAIPEKSPLQVKHGDETIFLLDKKGQLSLGLPEAQSDAKLHIRYRPDDGDTLLRIDNQANDDTPVTVTSDGQMGIGTASPHNMLDVTGSVSVGYLQPQPVSPEESLAVSNRLGVGTHNPMARVDIHTTETEDALIARSGDEKLLHVNRQAVTTETNLNVSGETSLQKTTVNDTLSVKQSTSLESDLTVAKATYVQGLLQAEADTRLQSVIVDGKATLNHDLIISGETKHDGSVAIGLGTGDSHHPNAGLHLRERDNQAAVKIENKLGDNQLLISGGHVRIGESGADKSVGLDVFGKTAVKGDMAVDGILAVGDTLTVAQAATVKQGATIDRQLTVTKSAEDSAEPALQIRVHGDQTAAQITRDEGETQQTLLIATGDKIGIRQASPKKALHVSGESRFDDPAEFIQSVSVGGNVRAGAGLDLKGRVRINTEESDKAQVHIARDDNQASLRVDGETSAAPALMIKQGRVGIATEAPQRHLDVKGDVGISGHLGVGDLLSAGDGTLDLYQQSTLPAVKVTKTGEESPGISIFHDRIGIHVAEPAKALHLQGDALLEDTTDARILNVRDTLTVSGSTALTSTDVTGKIRVNTPVEQDAVDVHLRQSGLSQTALRIDQTEKGNAAFVVKSGRTGINLADPQSALDVNGDIHGRGTLDITGKLTAHDGSYFEKTAYMMASLGFSVETPAGRIHIAEQNEDDAALRIDYGAGNDQVSLVAKQGKLGIGLVNPKVALDVKGDTSLDGELNVSGTTCLDNYLNVAQDAVFDSDLVVKEKAKLKDQAIIGRTDEIDLELTPNSQLYIADTHFKEAFRIDSADYPSLVFVDGKLGLGQDSPRVALDIAGEAYVSGSVRLADQLNIEGDMTAINNIEGRGKLDISQKATFGSDVLIRGDLYIEDKTDIEEELSVLGETTLKDTLTVDGNTTLAASLDVGGKTELKANLAVDGETQLKQDTRIHGNLEVNQGLAVSGPLTSGVAQAKAQLHFSLAADQDGMLFERAGSINNQSLLALTRQGQVAIGKSTAQATLDVQGDGRFSQGLNAASLTVNHDISGTNIASAHSIQIGDGPQITGFSTDYRLGGDNAANGLVPTQAAVKGYIDNVVVPFGQGGKTYTISSQADFDSLFNRGESTLVDTNTTVILLPLGNQDFGTTSYVLKNSVRLRQGVAIVGFNPLTTRIVKSQANNRFEVIGTQAEPVTQISMSGFTFDGQGLESGRNGGAIYLEYVRDCQFNCRLENHTTWGDGGAIYAVMRETSDPYTVSHIEARFIYTCQARVQNSGTDVQRNEGGAAYGLDRSVVCAYQCMAEQGGAVARCRASQVIAEGCSASQNGGAAYRCAQLRLNACDCSADMGKGKGGAAYFCSDMICEGQWLGNNAAEGPHIYASNNLTGELEERHYWKGDYIGRRIDDGTSVWRTHNE
jgi:cytoskeletal protein CcmA (bactofilin family)